MKNEKEYKVTPTNTEKIKDINNKNCFIMQIVNQNEINDNSEKIIIKKISDLLSDICDDNTKNLKIEKNLYIKPFLMRNIPPISIREIMQT